MGGAERVVATLANHLVNYRSVEIILLEKGKFYHLDPRIKITYLSNFSGEESSLLKLLFLPFLALKLKKYLKRFTFPILQSHLLRANYVNILAKLMGSRHIAQIVIPGALNFYLKGIKNRFNLFLIKLLFPKTDLIVWKSRMMAFCGIELLFGIKAKGIILKNRVFLNQDKPSKIQPVEFLKQELTKSPKTQPIDIFQNRIVDTSQNQIISNHLFKSNLQRFKKIPFQFIIPNPVDISKIQKMGRESVTDFCFNPNKVYLITVGRIALPKRQEWLIQTMVLLPSFYHLILIGDGPRLEELKGLTEKLSLSNRVTFLGRQQNPFKYITRSHLFLFASESEGFPNVLIEALACKVPIISSDTISGPREIIAPKTDLTLQLQPKDGIEIGDVGVLYPMGDREGLKKGIEILTNNQTLYNRLKKQSEERVLEFSLNKIANYYSSLFNLSFFKSSALQNSSSSILDRL